MPNRFDSALDSLIDTPIPSKSNIPTVCWLIDRDENNINSSVLKNFVNYLTAIAVLRFNKLLTVFIFSPGFTITADTIELKGIIFLFFNWFTIMLAWSGFALTLPTKSILPDLGTTISTKPFKLVLPKVPTKFNFNSSIRNIFATSEFEKSRECSAPLSLFS